jgi:hypothetical protein
LSGDDLLQRIIKHAPDWCEMPHSTGRAIEMSAGQVRSVLCHAVLCNALDPVGAGELGPSVSKATSRSASADRKSGGGLVFDEWLASTHDKAAEKVAVLMHYFHAATQPGFDIHRRIRVVLNSAGDDMDVDANHPWPEVVLHTGGLTDDAQDTTFANFANATYMFGKIVPSLGGVSLEELTQIEYAELLAGLLYFGKVDETDCVVAEGVKKFGEHTGYLTSFKCAGASEDTRIFRVVTMDAKNYSSTLRRSPGDPECGQQVTYSMQFHSCNVLRDVRKAYAGFRGQSRVATGMWGCGQFKGNCFLKFLQQYLAAAHAGVSVMSFSCFNNQPVADKCEVLVEAIQRSRITTSDLSAFLLSKLPQDTSDVVDDSVFLSRVLEWLADQSESGCTPRQV